MNENKDNRISASIKIQSAYKGYHIRKLMKTIKLEYMELCASPIEDYMKRYEPRYTTKKLNALNYILSVDFTDCLDGISIFTSSTSDKELSERSAATTRLHEIPLTLVSTRELHSEVHWLEKSIRDRIALLSSSI